MAAALRIATAGFRLIRQRPRAVLAWGFVYLVFAVVISLLTQPMIEQMLTMMPAPGIDDAPPPLDLRLMGVVMVVNLGSAGMMSVLIAAAMRAVLMPHEQGAFFIRVGVDELRVAGAALIMAVIATGIYLTMMMIGIMLAIALVLWGGATNIMQMAATAVSVMLACAVLMFVGIVYAQSRLAPMLPLGLVERNIDIGGAWRRTKGRVLMLMGGFLLCGLIVGTVLLVLSLPLLIPMFSRESELFTADDLSAIIALMRSPATYPIWTLMPLCGGFIVAMTGGALAQSWIETEPQAAG